MKKDVDKLDFWKNRIDTAVKEFNSVYVTTETAWEQIARYHKKTIDEIVGDVKVLDAACGYGRASEWFTKDYTGVDFSPDFIAKAKSKYPTRDFLVANLKSLPFEDKEFDWAICLSVRDMIRNYQSVEDWQLMEMELKRVAKKVLILEYTEPERYFVL